MQTLGQLAQNGALKGKRVLIRADLNVPQDDTFAITDDTRIRASLAAIQIAHNAGATVMVTSHLGRPQEGQPEKKWSLQPVAVRLEELLGVKVRMLQNWIAKDALNTSPDEVSLLENCRLNKGEKANDPTLAKKIASFCDIYVNDAFATAHRAEATTEGVGHYAPIACAGPLLVAELEAIVKALKSPARPLTAIVGGSKVSSKLTILESLAQKVDYLIVGGGIANTFLLAAGYPIGKSLAEPDLAPKAKQIIEQMHQRGRAIPLPVDVVVAKEFSYNAKSRTVAATDVAEDDLILDIGTQSAQQLAHTLNKPGTTVWNGPVGVFEIAQFARGTAIIAEAIANSSAFSLAGGGDTLAAIEAFEITDKIDYVSTGGGAFLEMLEGKQLPVVAMLESRS